MSNNINLYLSDRERTLLEACTVGIAGAGGLGSNCAAHLVRAGVRRLVIADFDVVMPGNLNRQFFFADQIGRKKINALRDNLLRIEPELELTLCDTKITPENAGSIFAGCGIVVEAFDHGREKMMLIETMLAARFEPDLDRMVAEADILSLHCPATPETHGIISAARIALMKPGACIINTARGELIDEQALVAALEAGRLAGAGLDVFSHEPAVDPRLLAHPGVVALPHVGSATFEGREEMGQKVIANIRFWADGHRPPDQVLEGWA